MKKFYITPIFLVVSILTAGVATGQTVSNYSGAGCFTPTQDLSIGSRSSEVANLQNFLVNQNYPGGGNWMVTGYFGKATAQAVRNFQSAQGLPATGSLDGLTRSAISRVSCASAPPITTQPTSSFSNTSGNLALTGLSQNTGSPGTNVTIYGTGFDATSNNVIFGTFSIGGISSNGTALTFTIPATAFNGTIDIKVTNSRGTSNSLSFAVINYPTVCGSYTNYVGSFGTSCGCNNYSCAGNLNPNAIIAPTIFYLNPATGTVGDTITIFGSGFTATGNSVHFGPGVIANLNSPDRRSVSFTLPSQLTGFGTQILTLSTYNVFVTNSAGYQSNIIPFTVTSLGKGGAPTIWSVNGPTTLSMGSTGVWSVVVNNPGNSLLTTSVNWGDQNVGGSIASQPQVTLAQGTQTLTFSHSFNASGIYTITFTTNNVSGSQTSSATVYVPSIASPNSVSLTSLSPGAGRVGTQVALLGSGFTALDNTVHFGVGGTQRVVSANGSTIYFTIPYSVSPCDLVSVGCYAPSAQVTPGSYPIFVTNAMGATAPLNFIVQ